MRVTVDLATDRIVAADATPEIGDPTTVNGRYFVTIPEGADVTVDATSHLTPQDATSISGLAASGLLARYPMYDGVVFNFFLEGSDVAALDLSPVSPTPTARVAHAFVGPRYVVGRSGAAPVGIAPNTIGVLPVSASRTVAAPGLIVTDTIDVSVPAPAGTQDAMVWWRLAVTATSSDVVAGYGATAGVNTPALKTLTEIEADDPDIDVFASNDDGVTWVAVSPLTPFQFAASDTNLRLAFANYSASTVVVLAYAILYDAV